MDYKRHEYETSKKLSLSLTDKLWRSTYMKARMNMSCLNYVFKMFLVRYLIEGQMKDKGKASP